MRISELINNDKLLVWGNFSGVPVQVEYVPRERMQALLEGAKKNVWKATGMVEEMDEELTAKAYASLVHDWGLTIGDLKRFFSVEFEGDESRKVDCDDENKKFLLQKAYGFDIWLHNFVVNIQNFRAAKGAADTKN